MICESTATNRSFLIESHRRRTKNEQFRRVRKKLTAADSGDVASPQSQRQNDPPDSTRKTKCKLKAVSAFELRRMFN